MGLDNELRVSITADTEGLQGGLAEAQSEVTTSTDAMATSTMTLAQAQKAAKQAAEQLAVVYEQLGAAAADGNKSAQAGIRIFEEEAAAANAAVAAIMAHTESQKKDTAATYNRMEAMGSAKVAMGAMSGSLGGMEMGLARIAAGSKVLGPLLQEMIPLVLFAAGVEILYDLGKGIYNAFDMGGEAARAFQQSNSELDGSFRALIDSTSLEADKIEAANAKLEHRPNPNAAKEAIDEALVEADKMNSKLDGLIGKEEKMLKMQGLAGSGTQRFLFNETGTKQEQVDLEQHQIHLEKANSLEAQLAESKSFEAVEQKRLNDLSAKQIEIQAARNTSQELSLAMTAIGVSDFQKEIDALDLIVNKTNQETAAIQEQIRLRDANVKHEELTAQPKAAKAGPSDNMPEQIAKAQIDAAHAADAELNPMQQILGTLDKQLAMNQINAQYSKEGTAAEREKLRVLKDQADTEKAVADVNKLGDESIAKTVAQEFKDEDEAAKKAADRDKQSAEAWKKAHAEQIELAKEDARAEIEAAEWKYDQTKADIENQERLGRISHKTATQMLLDAQALKEKTTQGALGKVAGLYDPAEGGKELAEFKRAEDQMTAEARKAAREREQIEKQEQQQFIKGWKAVTNTFNQDFTQAFNSWMTHSETAGKAFGSMLGELERQTIDFVAMYILKKAEMWAMDETMQILGLTKQKATSATAAVLTITSDAGVAAAGAMAYYSAIDPITAPAMAAAQFAMTMAYAPASFAVGGVVPGMMGSPVPAIVHAGERVLTASQNSTYENLADSSNRSSSVHLNYAPIIHGNADAGMLQEHSRQMMGQVRRMLRPEALA